MSTSTTSWWSCPPLRNVNQLSHVEIKNLKPSDLTAFFDSGRNLFVVADIDASQHYRRLLHGFGLELDEFGHQLRDNFKNNGEAIRIFTSNIAQIYPFLTDRLTNNQIVYSGAGFRLASYVNNQQFALVKG